MDTWISRLRRMSFFFAAFALVATGCSDKKNEQKKVKIGVIAPITGDVAAIGEATVNAAQLAVKEINAAGGLPLKGGKAQVELIIEDDKDSIEKSVEAVRKLTNQDGVIAIIGPQLSRTAAPASDVAEKARVPLITAYSTVPKTTLGKKYIFRIPFVDPFQGLADASFALNDLKVKKVAILIDEASDFQVSIAKIFADLIQKGGGQVVAFETYTTGTKDYSKQLKKIKDSGAELIFMPNYYNEIPEQAKQIRAMGINAILLGADPWAMIPPENRAVLDGSYFTAHYAPDADFQVVKDFKQKYVSSYGHEPKDVAALTYDAFGLLFQAIKNSGQVNSDTIKDGLLQIKAYPGVTGDLKYEGSGDPIKAAAIMKVQGKDFKLYKWFKPEDGLKGGKTQDKPEDKSQGKSEDKPTEAILNGSPSAEKQKQSQDEAAAENKAA